MFGGVIRIAPQAPAQLWREVNGGHPNLSIPGAFPIRFGFWPWVAFLILGAATGEAGANMGFQESLFLVFSVIGGVALFILGMTIMTDGLRHAAGERLRVILFRATRNRMAGVGFGSLLGFLIHSSAASVMTVGFVNAGLMTLRNGLPLLMGASIGTTLSMQLISFRLTEYAFVAIAIGFICQAVAPRGIVKNGGRTLLGFGLLFLGLDYLSGAIEPYREQLAPLLARIDGTSFGGMFFGILLAFLVTAVIQSSGATIGMLFALIGAGIFTSLREVFPIVLGAHIGTAATALLASIGAGLEARRAALANLLFQFFNVALAIALAAAILPLVAAMGGDLVRQTANLHTVIMVVAVGVLLPVVPLCVRVVYRLTPARGAVPQTSFLKPEHLDRPEKALYATLQELGRAVAVCRDSFGLARGLFEGGERGIEHRIRLNEGIINEIRAAVMNYLAALARGHLSRRQALMVQYLSHCMADIERVGDHVERLMEIRRRQKKAREGRFDPETDAQLAALLEEANAVLEVLSTSLSPETSDFDKTASDLIAARGRYDERSQQAKSAVNERVAAHKLHPLTGLFFSDYVSALDRIVKHCKMIAREQQQPFFRIKPRKIEKAV